MISAAPVRLLIAVAFSLLLVGCSNAPVRLSHAQQKTIDRAIVEYPTGFELKPYIANLTAPTSVAFDNDGSILIAEGGIGGYSPRIFGYKSDGTYFQVYPVEKRIPRIPLLERTYTINGPIGGMVVVQGRVYVSHRDERDRGAITAFGYDGSHTTVVADLPAEGDYSVTDIAVNPTDGRLFFGVGAATNSSVVGLDNWSVGWVRQDPLFCDRPAVDLRLFGYRFDTKNPIAGLFGPAETAVSAPFQPFGTSNRLRVPKAGNQRPTAAVYSVNPSGGGLRVEAHGVRCPAGLGFSEYRCYMTNQGMELRGTRPVKDDPDSFLRVVRDTWYGWPDYSTDLHPITERRYQPPAEMIITTGYPELSFVIDHAASGLLKPERSTLLKATFPPLSGAAKMDFAPAAGPFKGFRGNAIVALCGDRAPFATSGQKLVGPVGHKIVRVDVDTQQVRDFIRNTEGMPASMLRDHPVALERPVDVKFGPDGAMYIVDMGEIEMKTGEPKVRKGTGRIFRLIGVASEPAVAAR